MIIWDKAPHWANYRTEDKNGEVWYFEESPLIDVDDGYWYAEDGLEFFSKKESAVFEDWEMSLVKR